MQLVSYDQVVAGRVILATNPVFPPSAQRARLSWIGLTPEDFDHVTHYENSHYCKPNVAYYEEILRTIGASPEECVMIGNDAKEDTAVEALGVQVFLLTDCLLNGDACDIGKYPNGGFDELLAFIEQL